VLPIASPEVEVLKLMYRAAGSGSHGRDRPG